MGGLFSSTPDIQTRPKRADICAGFVFADARGSRAGLLPEHTPDTEYLTAFSCFVCGADIARQARSTYIAVQICVYIARSCWITRLLTVRFREPRTPLDAGVSIAGCLDLFDRVIGLHASLITLKRGHGVLICAFTLSAHDCKPSTWLARFLMSEDQFRKVLLSLLAFVVDLNAHYPYSICHAGASILSL